MEIASKPGSIDKWRTASELLERVLELPESEQHEAATLLGTAFEVPAELRSLLASARRRSLLDHSLEDLLSNLSATAPATNMLKGRVFGAWKLGDEVGRGGMSVVYHATRSGDGYEQHAALKVLSIAFLGKQHIDAFLGERNILSQLDHPGIARLIDGGVTPEGSPFLVMEYVDGQRIDRWCKANQPDARQIAGIVMQLCQAVAHAHRHLVIHRDINPANVLINQRSEPILVDFGIARLLSAAEPGKTLQAFTPEYAAPEQVQGAGITTATDVYGLGCVLKRLLGDLPMDRDLRLVTQVATHTDPQSRYASASALADDLSAWLQQRPIRARPDSLTYRIRKFSARNRNAMMLAGLAAVIAMAGIIGTTWQSRQSRIESEKHQAIADFMLRMFQQADLMQSGADLRVTELLQAAADQAGDQLEQSPDSLAALLSLIASGQIELTSYPAAEAALSRAEALIRENRVSVGTRAEFLTQRARLAYELGDHSKALEFADQSMELLKNSEDLSRRYFAAAAQAISYRVDTYQYANALSLAEQVFAQVKEVDGDAESRALITHRYAIALEVNEQFDAAFHQYDLALQLQAVHQPENNLGRASILSDYGIALYFAGQYEKSEQLQREALVAYSSQFSPPHPRLSSTLQNISMALAAQDRLDEAIDLLEQSIAMSVELHGSQHVDTLQTQMGLGTLLTRNQQYAEAEQLLLETLEILEQDFADTDIQLGIANSYLAEVYFQSGRWEESKYRNLTALELFEELPDDHVRVIATQKQLADIDQQLRRKQSK